MKIKDIPQENRPRERLKRYGAFALSDADLLAVILQIGSRGENVVDMCNRLISFYGLENLSDLSDEEFQKVYFFIWDDVPGKDSEKFLKYLQNKLEIDWVKNAEISKSEDKKTIVVKSKEKSDKEKSATFKLDKVKKKAILETHDGRNYECIFKKENGKINIYHKIKGMGDAKTQQIKALFGFIKRYNLAKKGKFPVRTAKDVFEYVLQRLPSNDKEHFMVLHLDSKNMIMRDEVVSTGILNASIIHPREVFKSAIKESANAIIIVHNHPSGDPTPSEEDRKITKILFDAGKLLDIKLLDHVIIGNTYYSFKENKEL
ncbi:hypothetical protein MSIBF_A2110002 [groundwater metagenome]|uniref:MPN domain-containing protein n=1 Tax=groundwater metagenome TaxID=717931 RepID=A0A098EBA5_9ZZZZ